MTGQPCHGPTGSTSTPLRIALLPFPTHLNALWAVGDTTTPLAQTLQSVPLRRSPDLSGHRWLVRTSFEHMSPVLGGVGL
jgi:hypothetical protein